MLRRKQINLITCAPASLTLPHMGHLGQLLGRDVPAYSVNWNQPFKVYHIFTHPTFYSPDVNAPLGDAVLTVLITSTSKLISVMVTLSSVFVEGNT